jgi:cardiolipin synthase
MRSVHLTSHNELTLLHGGGDFFPALLESIKTAAHEIYLETYIFAEDEMGLVIRTALQEAASRGVIVNVIVDWLGTGSASAQKLQKEFARAQVQCRIFNPWFKRGVVRSHRKMCVIDRQVAYIGGLNINNDMRADNDPDLILPAPRWDFAVKVIGPMVKHVHFEAEAQWIRLGRLNLRLRMELFREVRQTAKAVSGKAAHAGLVVRDNLRNRRTIQRNYMQALGHAKKSALLANPYFAPGRKMRDALANAAARGVDVTLLLGVGEFTLQDAITHAFYPKLLKSGVKIVEYRKTQLHAKVAVVDDHWATVGSSNIDGFSLFVNQEANVVVHDQAFSIALRKKIEAGVIDGVLVKLEDFSNIPWYKRVWYDTAYFLYRMTIRIITWGQDV